MRNLIFNSEDQIRLENLPGLLEDTQELIVSGNLTKEGAYNQKQVDEELKKANFISSHPELQKILFRLEDHTLIRGCVAAFELDATTFEQRVAVFCEVFSENGGDNQVPFQQVSAALLACGDYSQQRRWGRFQFGSWNRNAIWRQLFTNTASNDLGKTRDVLMQMLDKLNGLGNTSISVRLQVIIDDYLADQEHAKNFDWRYYLVKYEEMRQGDSGIYVGSQGAKGFSLCMLYKERLNSYYRDPYLFAVFTQHNRPISNQDIKDPWHTGFETETRWLELVKSGIRLTCQPEGFLLDFPVGVNRNAYEQVLLNHGVDVNTLILSIPQMENNDILYDTLDRVQAGVALVRDLISNPV